MGNSSFSGPPSGCAVVHPILLNTFTIASIEAFIEQALELVKKAKDQGIPQDPEVRRPKAMDLPVTVVMPSSLTSTFDELAAKPT